MKDNDNVTLVGQLHVEYVELSHDAVTAYRRFKFYTILNISEATTEELIWKSINENWNINSNLICKNPRTILSTITLNYVCAILTVKIVM